VTVGAGLAATPQRGTGFGAVLADFDHDGAVDLAVVNGRILKGHRSRGSAGPSAARDDFWAPYAERNQLFVNDGKGRFRDVCLSNRDFCGREGIYRGLACGDIDGDGAVDLLVTSVAGPARLFKNVAPKRGHWLIVRVVDPAWHRDAYGAEVTVTAGGRRWKGWVNPGFSYLCSNDPRVHFGLGTAANVERFEVQWPDGACEEFTGCATNQAVELRRNTSRPIPQKRASP
jgi:enediyne biosynthesis protein E4